MTDDLDNLLLALLEDPEDELAYDAVADFLEESGEAHLGAFVRSLEIRYEVPVEIQQVGRYGYRAVAGDEEEYVIYFTLDYDHQPPNVNDIPKYVSEPTPVREIAIRRLAQFAVMVLRPKVWREWISKRLVPLEEATLDARYD